MTELRGLGAKIEDFKKAGATLVAISAGTPEENRELKAPFPVLSDADFALIRKLGMLHEKAYGDRDASRPGTYVVDRDGRVRWFRTSSEVRTRPDPAEILAAVTAIPRP